VSVAEIRRVHGPAPHSMGDIRSTRGSSVLGLMTDWAGQDGLGCVKVAAVSLGS
jgi:hypothetical protein